MLNRRRLSAMALVLGVGLVVVVAGCENSDGVLGVSGGRVQFVLSSGVAVVANEAAPIEQAPGVLEAGPAATDWDHDHDRHPFFESANVTFSSILGRNLDGVLVNVAMALPVTVDVLSLDGGREVTLPDGELEPGTYDQVVVVMTEVQGVTYDGTTITIDPPGGGWTAIVPICPFVVEEGATAVVGLKLQINRAFSWRNNRFHFQPSFTCEEEGEGEGEG